MNIFALKEIIEQYETITIQTKQITIKNLNEDKIYCAPRGLIRLTINSNEDVFVHIDDIKAVYGKNRR